MFYSKLTALLAALAATASATSRFSVSDLVASDIRVPSASHYVSFHLTNPSSVQQGGNQGANCTISWEGAASKVPTCYTECESHKTATKERFLTRVVPGTYEYAGNFDLQILELYAGSTYGKRESSHGATLHFVEGEDGVFCSRGGQSDVCSVQSTKPWSVEYTTKQHVRQPKNVCK